MNAVNAIVNFSSGSLINVGATSVNMGSNSLLIVPAGFDPWTRFGSYGSQGLTHTAGSTLVVPAGKGFGGRGSIRDPVDCQGTITATSGFAINLYHGLAVSSTGAVLLGTGDLWVDDAVSGISGGLLSASSQKIGNMTTGLFTQSGGTNTMSTYLYLGYSSGSTGTYSLSGSGKLSGKYEYVGYFGEGTFTQSGGTNTVWSLSLGRYYSGSTGSYNLSGSGQVFANYEFIGDGSRGTFTQSGGTNAISSTLYLGYNSGSSGTYNLDGGTLVVSSLSKGSGTAAFNFNGGTLKAGGTMSTSLPMTLGGGDGATFDTAGYAVTLSGSLSGPGGLTKIGSGALTLATTNTFIGNTLVSSGTLALGKSLALQRSTLDTSGTGTLSFGSLTAATLGGLAGSGSLSLSNTASAALVLSVGNNNTDTTYSGALKGTGSLAKIGTGALTFSGSNTYSGLTTINQGSLLVNGWLTNSAVSVNSGGTLGGTGSLAGVIVNAGGHLAPGDLLGVLHLNGNLVLSANAAMDFDLDTPGTSDEVSMPLSLLSLHDQQFSDFHFPTLDGFGPGTYILIDAGSTSGKLGTNTSGIINGLPATLAISDNDLVLNVVPEPSTFALLGIGAIGLLGWAWRRRLTIRSAQPESNNGSERFANRSDLVFAWGKKGASHECAKIS